ncbi:uncharacterized protein LOC125146167 isoform X1 [Tachysurus fulvidraco]|uniref:uncharacterized protein LOC125146167 isoform X1 n=2 Tax=Tachysurus fulvidraco TaxID=1234273 RepID=UPI001FED8F51|nr:uncharacterized protein LOC125146167 isoform X1 [Tachysurus fulvidraco]XP_047678104.1 uncharacterized protein LOC125146167 isoform X1 [Tachysurus fulvidraco]
MPYANMMTPRWMRMDTHKLTIQLLWNGRRGKIQNMADQYNRFQTNAKLKEFLQLDSEEMDRPLPKKRATVPPSRYTDSDETDAENTVTQKKKTVVPKPQRNVAQTVINEYQAPTLTETQKRLKEMQEENQKLRNDNDKLRKMLIRELPNLITEVKMALKSQCSSTSSASSDLEGGKGFPLSVTEPSPPKAVSTEQVEISPGLNVFVDRLAWAVAQNANSASCFVRTLLTAVFPIDVLLVSNLRGTSRDSGPQCQALDKIKVDAIYRATLQKWPHVVPSSIGVAINAKLTEIRGKKKTKKDSETLMLFDD